MTLERRLHVVLPNYMSVGGIVKMLDYAVHARALDYHVKVWCSEPYSPDLPVLQTEAFRGLVEDPEVEFHSRPGVRMRRGDLFFVSLPKNYHLAYRQLPDGASPERLIHIIQNVRHTNPVWRDGEGTRILTRPASRISINRIVAEAIEPWVDPRAMHRVINIGHENSFFARERTGGLPQDRPIRVAYTTWKSDVGDRVSALMRGEDRFEFRAIRQTATWEELRELYHWADVFLSSPHQEEGLYLPGPEAFAAGCLLITPDVGGNMAYSRPDENCLLVAFDDAADYRRALHDLAGMETDTVEKMRRAGYEMTHEFDLEAERRGFESFLEELWERVRRAETTDPLFAEER